MSCMNFTLVTRQGCSTFSLAYQLVFAIGYAGRNMEKTMEHIRELERDLGVPAPRKSPPSSSAGTMS